VRSFTGRVRVRSQRRGLFGREELVFQVEETWVETYDLNGTGHYDDRDRLEWRDAQVTDLACPQLPPLKD
jgi:hypothetical protein